MDKDLKTHREKIIRMSHAMEIPYSKFELRYFSVPEDQPDSSPQELAFPRCRGLLAGHVVLGPTTPCGVGHHGAPGLARAA